MNDENPLWKVDRYEVQSLLEVDENKDKNTTAMASKLKMVDIQVKKTCRKLWNESTEKCKNLNSLKYEETKNEEVELGH